CGSPSTATDEIRPLSLHDALPISCCCIARRDRGGSEGNSVSRNIVLTFCANRRQANGLWPLEASMNRETSPHAAGSARYTWNSRSEEHTSELQSREKLVCRLLLDK